jgi:serine protease AprX
MSRHEPGSSWGRRFTGRPPRKTVITKAAITKAVLAAAVVAALLPSTGSTASAATTINSAVVLDASAFAVSPSGTMAVIVRAHDGQLAAARNAVVNAHGTIGVDLSIIDGFAASIPATALSQLQHASAIVSITPDVETSAQGSSYSPYTDPGGPVGLSYDLGSIQYWNNGFTGRGVGVALIDSGIAPVDALAAPGKVFYGPDFTPTGYFREQRGLDGYGHGTFMAGLIAGRDPGAHYPYINSGAFVGVAPDAHIVSVKVADYNGATTESAVIAGMQWAVQHRDDPGLNIKVMNLSLGVRDGLPYTYDPIDAAAEVAWKSGITVVAAAGNDHGKGLLAPANDPYVIAVGAVDGGNTLSVADDKVASFSDVGDGRRNPDIAALGTHIVSLRDPGSTIDQQYGRGPGSVTAELMRGSGTSESAAITSGAVALLVSQRPGISPDQVKATLKAYAMPLPNLTPTNAGAGALNLAWIFPMPTANSPQYWPSAARWIVPRTDTRGAASSTPQGAVWSGAVWSTVDFNGAVWTGAVWSGAAWTGAAWTGAVWSGAVWSGAAWTGAVWSGAVWSDANWQTDGWR